MKNLIKNLSKSIMDNLKDAQMAYDWAKEAKAADCPELATFFISRAKVRLQMLSEDHGKVVDLIKKLEANGETIPPGRYAAFHDCLIEQKDELEYCLNHFKM